MLTVPREYYVPAPLRLTAYMDGLLDLGGGRAMLEPRVLAKALDALDIQPTELVLDLGCGLGYSSAVIAQLAQAVVAVEEGEAMASEAEAALGAAGVDNVAVITAALVDGAPQHGPYDVIILQGGVEALPDSLVAQLKDGGRVACLMIEGNLGTCKIGLKTGEKISWRSAFDATAPILPGFYNTPAFQF
jgi:protein-L-isoaspartate(D-aspartate) O-methyltransferase